MSAVKSHKIQLGEKDYSLRFNFKALKQIREETGESILQNAEGFFENIDEDKILALLMAGIQEDVEQEEVEENLDLQNLPTILEQVVKAFNAQTEGSKKSNVKTSKKKQPYRVK